MTGTGFKRIRILINPKSGLLRSFDPVRKAFDRYWESRGIEITYQFLQSAEDGAEKAGRAVDDGVDLLFVAGGDGTVNTVGTALIGKEVCLGIIPMGSGNGFARHFSVPLSPEDAVRALANATIKKIDVGIVDKHPFFVTCSMAWDCNIVKAFEKMPVRGIIPYFFAGAYEFFDYKPQAVSIKLDSGEKLDCPDPLVFTIANLTQYGSGAIIAPHAKADDGLLELVIARHQDSPYLFANIGRLLNGTVRSIPRVIFRSFKSLIVRRSQPASIQIDGELVDAPAEIKVKVLPRMLKILVPSGPK